MEATTEFEAEILRSLRDLSPDLVEAGVAGSRLASVDSRSAGSFSVLLRQVQHLILLTPKLVDTLDDSASGREEHYATRLPRGAQLARTPRSYQLHEGRMLPREWLRPEPVLQRDLRPLAFLLFLLETTGHRVAASESRVEKYLEDALPARAIASTFARAEATALIDLRDSIRRAGIGLERMKQLVQARASFRVEAISSFPRPYPRASEWGRLRLLAHEILDPSGALRANLRGFLARPAHIADLPFLYQRWCGAMVLSTLESMGWSVLSDRVAPLFLGGRVALQCEEVSMTLWVEPRLTDRGAHPSALFSVGCPEISPDLVLITPGPGGSSAFVLDPTMSSDADTLASKGRYLAGLAFDALRVVAGNPVLNTPVRSWAAAPIRSRQCVLASSTGRSGTVPMHPVGFEAAPLRSWLQDIVDHARAWGAVRADPE